MQIGALINSGQMNGLGVFTTRLPHLRGIIRLE